MSTDFVFKHPGRLFHYVNNDQTASKDEILEKYARGSYSTENTWPYDSPSAGYYDITNSTTRLILLNNQKDKSHLRGQVKPKRPPRIKDDFYDWVEVEHEENQAKEAEKIQNPDGIKKRSSSSQKDRIPNPDRHFSHMGCSFRADYPDDSLLSSSFKREKSANSLKLPSRPKTAPTNRSTTSPSNQNNLSHDIDLINYLYYLSRQKTGYQHHFNMRKPPSEYSVSYNLNHPDLKKSHKLYINNLCHVYSVQDLISNKRKQYIDLLENRKTTGLHYKEDFKKYEKFLNSKRIVPKTILNTGYFHPKDLRSRQTSRISTSRPNTTQPCKNLLSEKSKQSESRKIVNSTNKSVSSKSSTYSSKSCSRSTSSCSTKSCSTCKYSHSSSSSSTVVSNRDKENKHDDNIKEYNNVISKDSFISSDTNERLTQRRKSGNSFSSSIRIDMNKPTNEDSSDDTNDRPIAPVERLDDSSNFDKKSKILIGHSHRRTSSVSSGASSIESSTNTITLTNDDLKINKTKIDNKSKRNNKSTSSISDISSLNDDDKNKSFETESTISSISNSNKNNHQRPNNRAKSAKTKRPTRQSDYN